MTDPVARRLRIAGAQRGWPALLLVFTLLAVLIGAGNSAPTVAEPADVFKPRPSDRIDLQNPEFAAAEQPENPRQPIADWTLWRRTEGVSVHADEDGALLVATADNTRGDLLSRPFALAPFHEIEVTLEYEVRVGRPLLYVGVRPYFERELVSQAFLPTDGRLGTRRRERVRLHSGIRQAEYGLQVSIGGDGLVLVRAIEARVVGEWERPNKPLLVLDIIGSHPQAPDDVEMDGDVAIPRWGNIDKLRTVFGFPAIVEVHFSAFAADTIREVDPALIVISGITRSLTESGHVSDMREAVRLCLDSGLPVVGACGGHQYMAKALGHGSLQRTEEWGSFPVVVDAWETPLVAGMPRNAGVLFSFSHNWRIRRCHGGMTSVAHTENDPFTLCLHPEHPWVSTQFHPERGWEGVTPAGYMLWRNILTTWDLID